MCLTWEGRWQRWCAPRYGNVLASLERASEWSNGERWRSSRLEQSRWMAAVGEAEVRWLDQRAAPTRRHLQQRYTISSRYHAEALRSAYLQYCSTNAVQEQKVLHRCCTVRCYRTTRWRIKSTRSNRSSFRNDMTRSIQRRMAMSKTAAFVLSWLCLYFFIVLLSCMLLWCL